MICRPADSARSDRSPRSRALRLAAMAALALLPGCKSRALFVERGAGISCAMPEGEGRQATFEPTDGMLEHDSRGKWRTRLTWEPDPRAGVVTEEEALQASGLAHASIARGARALRDMATAPGADGSAPPPLAVDGHPAAWVHSAEGDALVWRCERSGRLFVYLREGEPEFTLEELASAVRCHDMKTKPLNAQIPAANAMALGNGWALSKRTPSSTIYLRSDAMLELFAGRKTEPTDDLVLAAHLAPAWIQAAGLEGAHVETGEHTNGPQGHPAVSLRGEATLDGRAVRWSYLEWRCLQRARTYGALVVSEEKPMDAAAGAKVGSGWTGHDAALLAVRCHG